MMPVWLVWIAIAAAVVVIVAIAAFIRWLLRGEAEIDAAIADLERQVYGEDGR